MWSSILRHRAVSYVVTSVPKRPNSTIFSAEYRNRTLNKNLDNTLEITTLTTTIQIFPVVKPSNISRIYSFRHMYYASVHSLVMSGHSKAPCPFTHVSCQLALTCHVSSLSRVMFVRSRVPNRHRHATQLTGKKNTTNGTGYRIAQ